MRLPCFCGVARSELEQHTNNIPYIIHTSQVNTNQTSILTAMSSGNPFVCFVLLVFQRDQEKHSSLRQLPSWFMALSPSQTGHDRSRVSSPPAPALATLRQARILPRTECSLTGTSLVIVRSRRIDFQDARPTK